MVMLENVETLEREELIRLVRKLAERNAALEQEIEQLKRGKARCAAPFSKNKRKPNPKKPGRKPGDGEFKHRETPEPTEPPVQVPVAETECECGGELVADGTQTVTRTYMPRLEPVIRSFKIQICKCAKCGRRVRGKHPEVAPDQTGATANRVDDTVYAAAHSLHYGFGMPVRKVARVMGSFFGIALTQSAITQDALRRARNDLATVYEEIRRAIAESDVVYTDDTGWRIGGTGAFLMGFDSDTAAYFQIRLRHRNEEVRDVIGQDYPGVLSTDRGASYDAEELKRIPMNKCVSHILRNIEQLLESQVLAAQSVGCEIAWIVRQAIGLWKELRDGRINERAYKRRGKEIYSQLGHALRPRKLSPGNQALVDGLRWHYERDNLLRFLKDPGIEPTNNRAERILRPAVIQRKVSHCSKTQAGADATSVFTTIIQTCIKHGQQGAKALVDVFRGKNPLGTQTPT